MARKILHVIFLTILLAACNLPKAAGPASATVDGNVLKTQVVATVFVATQTASTPGSTPTISTPTPTADKPALRFVEDTNCRSGPGIRFDVVVIIKAGQIAELAGAPAQGGYWVVKSPSGSGMCWVVADFATPSGRVDQLPKMTAPPTYTVRPVPLAPSLVSWDYSCKFAANDSQSGSTVTVALKWQDMSNSETGYAVYRNNVLIASLPADSVEYTEDAYLGYGDSMSYFIEAANPDGAARSKVITISCQ